MMKTAAAAGAVAVLGTAIGVRTALVGPAPAPVPRPAAAAPAAAVWGTGKIEAWRQSVVSAVAPGRLQALLRRPGDAVRAGEPVAVLERGRQQAQLSRAAAAERQARREKDRAQRLFEARVESAEAVEKAQTDWDVANADLAAARAALDDAVVRAPFSGRVLNV